MEIMEGEKRRDEEYIREFCNKLDKLIEMKKAKKNDWSDKID